VSKPRQINARNEALSGLFLGAAGIACGATVAGTVAGFLGWPVLDGIQSGGAIGATVATVIYFKWQITGRGWNRQTGNRIRTHSRQFASLSPWYIKEDANTERVIKWYDRRDKPPEEFVFNGLGLPAPIPETMLYRFCKLALHRQAIVFDTECRTYKANGRKLRAHEVLSEVYFTQYLNPRFLPEQYAAIGVILAITGFWVGHRAGHPGYLLIPERISPQRLVAQARWRWIDIIVKSGKQPGCMV
jgi:hypothetical protein